MNVTKLKPKKNSLIEITKLFANNNEACILFFMKIKYPNGFYCEKCGCTEYYNSKRHNVMRCKDCCKEHYLFANTIFQDNKLDLFKLILGLYLFFSSNKGVSAIELSNALDVNYKTALLLARKCRILMASSNSEQVLDSMFYESDTVYIGAKSKQNNCQGCGTEQQPVLFMLSTKTENSVPLYMKIHVISRDNSDNIERISEKSLKMDINRELGTDGKTTYAILKDKIKLKSEKINYKEQNHRLSWLNIITGNIQNNLTGIYHGVTKRDLPLFLNEQQWRFNHRFTGKQLMNKISKYIFLSTPIPRKSIVTTLNIAESYFSPLCV